MCVHACVCERAHVPVSVLCVLTRYFRPRGHASGTSTYYICHCLYHVTSIFCIQVSLLCLEGQTRLPLPLLSPSLSVTPFLLPSLCVRLSFVSRLQTFHRRPSLISTWTKVAWEEVFKTVNSFGISGVEAFYAQLIFHFSFHIYFADKSSNDWRSVSFLSICCCLFPSRVAQCLY